MTPRQHDAAVIDLRRRTSTVGNRGLGGLFDQSPTAGGAPVGNRVGGKHRMAMAANAFHMK